MTIQEFLNYITEIEGDITIGGVIVIIVLSCIQVSRIKWNPWDSILGWFGSKINSSLNRKIDTLEQKFNEHIEESANERIENIRRDILDFCDSCMNAPGQKHTQEQFRFILKQCDRYETYIETKQIKNGEISSAMAEIRRIYQKSLMTNDFLKSERG